MKQINRLVPALGKASVLGMWLLIGLLGAGCQTTIPNNLAYHDSSRWEKTIAGYEAGDQTNAPPPGCIVFVGSSSIRLWTNLAQDFPKLPVVNRGFGGSQIADAVNFADRIIIPYRPRQVLLYSGSNDIAAGKDPELVFGDFVAFVKKINKALPDTEIAVISVNPSKSRWKDDGKVRRLNALTAEYCRAHRMTFINNYPLMLGADGLPNNDLFRADGLHMNPKGYAIWRQAIEPHLKRG